MPRWPLFSDRVFAYRSRVMVDRPSAYWRFSERSTTLLRDHSGLSGRDLTDFQGSVPTFDQSLLAYDTDPSMRCDGVTKIATASFDYAFPDPNRMTIEALVVTDVDGTGGARRTIYSANDVASQPGLELGGNLGTNRLAVIITGVFIATTADDFSIKTGKPAHIVYVRRGAGATHEIWVDGVQQRLAINATNAFLNGTGLKRVGSRTATSQFWDGLLDEVAVYPYDLAPEQIIEHHRLAFGMPSMWFVPIAVGAGGATVSLYRQTFHKPPPGALPNHGSPLIRRMVSMVLLNEPGGRVLDQITGERSGALGSSVVVKKGHAPIGGPEYGVSAAADASDVPWLNNPHRPGSRGSIALIFRPSFAAGDGAQHMGFVFENGGTGDYFNWHKWTDNNLYFGWQTSAVDYRLPTAVSGKWAAGDLVLTALTWDSGVPSRRMLLSVNRRAIEVLTSSAAAFSTNTQTNNFRIAGEPAAFGSYTWNGDGLIAFLQWADPMPDSFFSALAAQFPRGLTRESATQRWIPVGAAAGPPAAELVAARAAQHGAITQYGLGRVA
jgi:hypothetical protein